MSSYDFGKDEVCKWIRQAFPNDSTILDVGACNGKWRSLLPEYPNMDAVEVYEPNARSIERMYRNTFCMDVCNMRYGHYNLIIFGDVIEHMSVADAQACLKYAKQRCDDLIIGVPFLYKQGALYGNEYERHIQDDLTAELFKERYKGFEVLHNCTEAAYCYYHKEQTK